MNAKRDGLVLALNSGSSSLKFGLYRVQATQTGPSRSTQLEELVDAMSGALEGVDAIVLRGLVRARMGARWDD